MTKGPTSRELILGGADVPAPSSVVEVLYADADAAVRERTRAAMADQRETLSVASVGTVADALEVAAATPPDCLVVDPVELGDVAPLLSAVDAPVIVYTDRDTTELDELLAGAMRTVVEKGPSDRGGFLAEKVVSTVGAPTARSEHALEQALAGVSRQAETGQAVFLVEDSDIVWSSMSLLALVGTSDLPATADIYQQLAALCDDNEDAETVEQFATDPPEAATIRTGAAANERYLLLQRYPLDDHTESSDLILVRDITQTAGRAARLSMLELLTEQAQDGLYTLDERGVIDFCNDSFARNLGYEPAELRGEHAEKTLAPGELKKGQRTIAELLESEEDSMTVDLTFQRKDGTEREISIHYTLLYDAKGDYTGLMGVTRDITERKERQRELEAQRDELATLARVHGLIHDVIGALGSAATRSAIGETVCDRLVDSDLYQFAWIGEREGASTQLRRKITAGDDDSYLDIVSERSAAGDVNPGTEAIRTGEAQVVHDIETDDRVASWRDAALSREFRSVLVIPLRHDEAIHGVLAVYANRPAAFSQRAVEAFRLLGEMVGFAYTAVQNRQLLAHDRVIEMEFQSTDHDAYPLNVATIHDCVLRESGSVNLGDEVLAYKTVEGAPPENVLPDLLDHDLVPEGRVIRDDGDSGVVELRAKGSYRSVLLDAGVRPINIVADDEALTVTVEAPLDVEPRTILDTLSEHVPGFELVVKQARDRQPTVENDAASLREELTDRQHDVLLAAYLAGYYEWPRDTTAEQLAESLDIASSTLHQHLRRAERNLLDELLDIQ